ncbi:Endonuclease-reverse transcriptase [Popillia japonica]|uniref:Endonuclease-reverse transcriptase n=1 Tax=Popillia japonica TaxID=7064 RepID=A0AAW1JSY6_POPJA
MLTIARKVMVAGDFNATATHTNWGCTRNNSNGITLNSFINNNDVLLSYPEEPTHIPSNGNTPSVVDLVFPSNVRDMGDMRTETTTSDHVAVIFEVGDPAIAEKRITVNDYSKANWLYFRRLLESHPVVNEVNTVQDLDDIVDTFTRNITEAISKAIPQKTFNPNVYNELPPHVLRCIADRNKERRMYQRTRDLVHLYRMKELSSEIKRMIAEHGDATYTNRLRKINAKDGSIAEHGDGR